MSVTFTKLFSSITESTVWCESDSTRIVWITMLAMADRVGRVWASIPGLANRARVSIEATEAALEKFLSPDRYSRTPDFEGRRIEAIDGGWRLLNHQRYRQIRDEEAIKESKRKSAKKTRAAKKLGTKVDKSRCESNAVDRSRANADADAETIKNTCAFEGFYESYPKKVAKGKAEKVWERLTQQEQQSAIEALPLHLIRWTAENTTLRYILNPATWLTAKSWLDEFAKPPDILAGAI